MIRRGQEAARLCVVLQALDVLGALEIGRRVEAEDAGVAEMVLQMGVDLRKVHY